MESIFTECINTKRKSMVIAGRQTEAKKSEILDKVKGEKRRRSAMSDGQYPTLLVRHTLSGSGGKCKKGSGSGRNTDSTRKLFAALRLSGGACPEKQLSEEEKGSKTLDDFMLES
jgi:hypothetical protein